MTSITDKIIIDIKDLPELAEHFSRKEVGDKLSGKFSASLDENSEGVVTLSIDDISLNQSTSEARATPEGDEPVAVKAMRRTAKRDAQEEEGQ